MAVKFRNFINEPGFSEDFMKVRDFLVRINQNKVITPHWLWDRWEWGFSQRYLDTSFLSKIGLWEDDGNIVALATYEESPGSVWFCIDQEYFYLKKEMLIYAKENLSKGGSLKVLINDSDSDFQYIADSMGFKATQDKEGNSFIDITPEKMKYDLPLGYSITSLAEMPDILKYNRVLWRGFNHEGDPPETEKQLKERKISLSGPHVNRELNIAVVAPDGDFASYCGIWYDAETDYALVEPVATDPDHRLNGCGRAAVLEAISRCGKLGAKRAFVGSSQQFYYSIGFHPVPAYTFWEIKGL